MDQYDAIPDELREMVEGYRDGFKDNRDEFPMPSNRSAAYRHGWLNGRDDRRNRPRAPAAVLRERSEAILRGGHQ